MTGIEGCKELLLTSFANGIILLVGSFYREIFWHWTWSLVKLLFTKMFLYKLSPVYFEWFISPGLFLCHSSIDPFGNPAYKESAVVWFPNHHIANMLAINHTNLAQKQLVINTRKLWMRFLRKSLCSEYNLETFLIMMMFMISNRFISVYKPRRAFFPPTWLTNTFFDWIHFWTKKFNILWFFWWFHLWHRLLSTQLTCDLIRRTIFIYLAPWISRIASIMKSHRGKCFSDS